jgi:hypothetical protein
MRPVVTFINLSVFCMEHKFRILCVTLVIFTRASCEKYHKNGPTLCPPPPQNKIRHPWHKVTQERDFHTYAILDPNISLTFVWIFFCTYVLICQRLSYIRVSDWNLVRSLNPHAHYIHNHYILIWISVIMFGGIYKLCKFSQYNLFHPPVT